LPEGYSNVDAGGVNAFYYGGTFYVMTDAGYQVIAPPQGAVVNNLPDGAVAMNMGGTTYMKYNNTFYQPVQVDNQNAYEIVQVQ